jgi:hypothetical protein
MAGDPTRDGDDQDQAEVFDETNITRDGDDIAHPDMARDVYDVTTAEGDGLEGEIGEAETEDFDPDQADEAELEFMLESDEGVDESRAFVGEDGLLVAADDDRPADYEPEAISDEELEESGYQVEHEPSSAAQARDSALDEGLEETFPASDPVSINPGAD